MPSRIAFVASLTARAERALADGAAFGLCIVDLDHFKKINLSHGPTCGDDVLRGVAERLVRTTCAELVNDTELLVGRYDGDAFAVVVDSQSLRALATAAETLRIAVATLSLPTGARLSASVGAIQARVGEGTEALLVRAEQALYLAKQFGRDRVEIGRAPTPLRAGGTVLPWRRSA
jgi:diguanylate cyclase (GGDEF)-like protein